MTKLSPAGWCWLGLTIYIIGADSYLIVQEFRGKQNYYTMSSAFRNSLSDPVKRSLIIFIWISLTVHLFSSFLPSKYRKLEPIAASGEIFKLITGHFGIEPVLSEQS